jgi:hypothetical protein
MRRIHYRMRRLSIRIWTKKRRKLEWWKQHELKRQILLLLQASRAWKDRKNAGKDSKRTNLANTPKDGPTGQGSTSWTRIRRRRRSTLFTTMTSYTRMKKAHLTLPELNISQELQPFPSNFGFSVKSWMTPLIQAPSIIPQLILSLCTVSIATCNKLFENMAHFYGDNNKTKILGMVNGKNFYWKIDSGSAVTCMNINAFEMAFGKKKERQEKCKIDLL